jgi:tRNA threonylcarbamoyladenosine biosynthesis protein TsaB
MILVLDTATAATVAGVASADGALLSERRHDPAPGERPGHVAMVLELAEEACAAAGVTLGAVERIGIGVGPGSFTGLRIGIATARALAHATGAGLAPVSTLGALAVVAPGDAVLAVLDARRGEAFVARWEGGREVLAARTVAPAGIAGLAGAATLAVGDGAVRFRGELEPAGVTVPEDGSALHRVGAEGLARLAAAASLAARDAVVPDYVRAPDAKPRSEQQHG